MSGRSAKPAPALSTGTGNRKEARTLRVWDVTVTIVEDWKALAVISVRRFEVLGEDEIAAERVITDHLTREYGSAVPEVRFDIREFVINPKLYDVNALRDGLVPDVQEVDG